VKRVLFVDDDAPVLEGLRLRMHRLARKWQMEFVTGAELALEAMERQPYDVIVTDMRMPGMDGGKLLEIVSARWPQTVRIVLSGYSETEPTIHLIPFVHQYLGKPCEPQQLENIVERCLGLQALLSNPALRGVVGRIRKLPSLPQIYTALQNIVSDESVTLREVAELVAADPALAARLLQIVNSAFFRLARRITNIEQAVNYLGFAAIRNLALSVEVFAQWPAGGSGVLNLAKLQSHAQLVAAAAHSLTVGTRIADDTLLAGLLHDIGYWVLAQECPEELRGAVERAVAHCVPLHVAEAEIIGASHAEIGAYLLGIWGLPYPVIEAVAHHHLPGRVVQSEFDILAAVCSAHALVPEDDASVFDAPLSPDPRVDESYLASVNAPFNWPEATRRVAATLKSQEPLS
jgi:HD-like signal output (HDOD) protein/ActR/RegA family two-component response regulator